MKFNLLLIALAAVNAETENPKYTAQSEGGSSGGSSQSLADCRSSLKLFEGLNDKCEAKLTKLELEEKEWKKEGSFWDKAGTPGGAGFYQMGNFWWYWFVIIPCVLACCGCTNAQK